jgi:hypothetical protein
MYRVNSVLAHASNFKNHSYRGNLPVKYNQIRWTHVHYARCTLNPVRIKRRAVEIMSNYENNIAVS